MPEEAHLRTVIRRGARAAKRNSPNILAALGVSAILPTAYFAARAGYDSAQVLEDHLDLPPKERAKLVWKLYIPAGLSGLTAAGLVIASTRVSSRRTAAVAAAYSLSERAFAEYRDKIIEELGPKKEQGIRDKLAEETVAKMPPHGLVIVEGGPVLCCELHTRRFFHSTKQDLDRAEIRINSELVQSSYVALDEFYDLIGLEHTSHSDQFGWESDKLLELQFTVTMSPDGIPCIAFDYNYLKPLR